MVQVILNPSAIEQAHKMKLGENAKRAITSANPYREGLWLLIPVVTDKDLCDVEQLLPLRIEPKHLKMDD